VLEVSELDALVATLGTRGRLPQRHTGRPGGRQILCEGSIRNVVELFRGCMIAAIDYIE